MDDGYTIWGPVRCVYPSTFNWFGRLFIFGGCPLFGSLSSMSSGGTPSVWTLLLTYCSSSIQLFPPSLPLTLDSTYTQGSSGVPVPSSLVFRTLCSHFDPLQPSVLDFCPTPLLLPVQLVQDRPVSDNRNRTYVAPQHLPGIRRPSTNMVDVSLPTYRPSSLTHRNCWYS